MPKDKVKRQMQAFSWPSPQQQPKQLAAPRSEDGTLKLKADLAVVFEDLLQCVRDAEANWRFDDRLDLWAANEGWGS